MAQSPLYFLTVNALVSDDEDGNPVYPPGSVVSCESLGIDPVSIRKASLDVDVLELEQHRVRGAWAVTLAQDDNVRLIRQDPVSGALEQLFCGKVISPMSTYDAGRRRRVVRVHNVMQLARECLFTRGRWVTHFLPQVTSSAEFPLYPVDASNNRNGHECRPFVGQNFFEWPYDDGPLAGYRVARVVRQSVRRALDEWSFNFGRLVRRFGYQKLSPLQAGLVWGCGTGAKITDLGRAVWPDTQSHVSLSYLDWLIKITQPLPDVFSSVSYTASAPVVTIGRFSRVTAVALDLGHPCMSVHVGRQIHDEATAVLLINQGGDAERIARTRIVRARYPGAPTPTPNLLNRRVMPIDFQYALTTDPDSAIANTFVNEIGQLLTAPRWTGSLTLAGGAWAWCRPGSVLTVAGEGRLSVQETTHDLSSDSLAVSVGPPRHLGQYDSDDIISWVRGNFFPTEATP